MCAIGLFLFCYVGSTQFENWTGNLGCLAAIGVALFPIEANSDPLYQSSIAGYLHTIFGGLFFLTLSLFSIYHFPHNEPEDDSGKWDFSRKTVFRINYRYEWNTDILNNPAERAATWYMGFSSYF